jgi:hypothetical protein
VRFPIAVVVVLVLAMRIALPAARVGTGVIAGTLVAADTGRAVRFARVSLVDVAGSAGSMIVTTDDQGAFSFVGLSAGSYLLSASKSGFLPVKYGERTPGFGRAGLPIQIAIGQRLERLTLAIPRAGVLTGVVLDDAGDPAFGTSVRALRYVMQSGVRTLLLAGTATADDRGVYRIPGLPPGDYVVTATPSLPSGRSSSGDFAMQAEMGRVIDAARAGGWKDSGPERTTGYVPVYFPGTTSFPAASTITIGVSEERSGVDVQLQLVPLARVSGIVFDTDGSVPRAEVDLVAVGGGGALTSAASPMFNMTLGPDGRFSFDEVPPGQYMLIVRARLVSAPGRSSLSRWARQNVVVSGSNVADLTLTLQRSLTVSGVLAFDGPAPVISGHLGVSFQSAGEWHNLADQGSWEVGAVNESWRFTMFDLVPGRYHVTVTPMPQGWRLMSAMFGGRDALDFPLEIKPGEVAPPGVLTLSPRQTELSGTLFDRAGASAAGYTVVVFPADTTYWTPDSRRIQAMRPQASGRFSFKNLPPGNYRLAAAADVESGQWFDPAFLRELAATAIPLTISDGESKAQDLRIR